MILTICFACIALISILLIFPGKDHTNLDQATKIVSERAISRVSFEESTDQGIKIEERTCEPKCGSLTADDTKSSIRESIITISENDLLIDDSN